MPFLMASEYIKAINAQLSKTINKVPLKFAQKYDAHSNANVIKFKATNPRAQKSRTC